MKYCSALMFTALICLSCEHEVTTTTTTTTAPVSDDGRIEVAAGNYEIPWMKDGQSAWFQVGDYIFHTDQTMSYERCDAFKELLLMSEEKRFALHQQIGRVDYYARQKMTPAQLRGHRTNKGLLEGKGFGPILAITGGYVLIPAETPVNTCYRRDSKPDEMKDCLTRKKRVMWKQFMKKEFHICRPPKNDKD
jgi:hypothetical protein